MKSKESLKNNSLSEKEEKLVRKLVSVWKDEESIMGVIFMLKNDEEIQEMIDYIDSGKEKSPSDITTKALLISKENFGNI